MQSEPGVVRLNCNPSRRPGCLGRRDGLKTDRKSMSHPLARIRVPRENEQKSRVGFFRRDWEIQACEKGDGCLLRKGKEGDLFIRYLLFRGLDSLNNLAFCLFV